MVTAERKRMARAGRAGLQGAICQGWTCAPGARLRYLCIGWMKFLSLFGKLFIVEYHFEDGCCDVWFCLSWFENSTSAAVSACTAPGLGQSAVPRPSSAAGLGAGTREQDPDGSSVVHPWTLLGLRGKRSLLVGAVAIEYFWEVTGGHRWGGPAKEQADTGKQPPREP